MATAATSMLRRAVDVRDGEASALLWSFAYFFCLLSGYYVLRPIRDEMGVAAGVENLQWLFTGTFLAMLAAVPLFGAAVARLPRRRFVPLVYRFFLVCLLLFFALLKLEVAPVGTARAFFIWVSVFNLFVVSVFWSVMADLFSNAQGRRLFGFIAAGGSAGAIVGPALTAQLAVPLGPVNLLLVAAGLLELAVWCLRGAARSTEGPPGPPAAHSAAAAAEAGGVIGGGVLAGLRQTVRSPYLLGISAYIVLMTFAATVLYFQQADIVASASDDSGVRTRIFASIDLAVSVLTVLLQAFVTGRFIRAFGLTAALAFLPAVALAGFAGLALAGAAGAALVPVIVAVQAIRRAANFAISRPAREVLFTVVRREEKYKSKNVIDTLVYRGDAAASGWLYAGIAAAGASLPLIAALAAPVAGLWLALAAMLGRRQETLARRAAGAGKEARP